MTAEEETQAICGLCGNPILRPKGLRKGAVTREGAERVHAACKDTLTSIRREYPMVNDIGNLMAFKAGLIELFPELEQTKPVKEYRAKVAECNAKIYETFPFLERELTRKRLEAVKAAAAQAKVEVQAEKSEQRPAQVKEPVKAKSKRRVKKIEHSAT